MAMLRVSSYRRLFEEEQWARSGRSSMQCADEYRSPARGAAGHKCECEQLDFVGSKAMNKEGLSRFTQDRTILAALNNRLVSLIEMARCFEEENEFLETQILALEDRMGEQQASSTTIAVPSYSLEAVVERLRKDKEEAQRVTEELRSELDCLKQEHQNAVQQRTLIQEEREDVALDVDAVTADCLALKEQVCIYEEQLANMEAQHAMTVETLVEPAEGAEGAWTAVEFCSPDTTPALHIKEYYCQLAESLQYECGASSAVVAVGNLQQGELAKVSGSKGADVSKITDVGELKKLIAELEKELMELEKCNEELEDEVEMKKAEYVEQIEELECRIEEMQYKQEDLTLQMREQCEEYKELLSEKMARDLEIAAYRGLVEEEDERLCYL